MKLASALWSALVAAALTLTATAQYSVSGVGGAIPDGVQPVGNAGTILPASFAEFPLTTPVPATATNIKRVVLTGLTHTWPGDLQIVLVDPSGATGYNLVSRLGIVNPAGNCCGFACDIAADFTIVDPASPSITNAWGTACATNFSLVTGTYPQDFGVWVSGSGPAPIVNNTAMGAIPVTAGTWRLRIYDGALQDFGSIVSWTMEGDAGPAGPVTYCTSSTSTNGCVAAISATAQPSASQATPCTINVANVEGQKQGLAFYGLDNTGFTPLPWSGTSTSFLCVKAPTQRTFPQSSGGTINQCNGAFAVDLNNFFTVFPGAIGLPFTSGDKLFVQAWFRDPPASKTTNLSNALEMTMQP